MPDIIVVEDNVEIGGLLCDFLRKENYTVSLAETGRQALDLYEKIRSQTDGFGYHASW